MKKQYEKNESVERVEVIDWLKAWAIVAVILDHLKIVPEPFVIWSVNIFALVTAAVYSIPGYVFSLKKLALKFVHLAYLYVFGILFFDLVFGVLHEEINRSFLSLLVQPVYIFIKNPYLGDIWYLSLHLQILVVLYVFLKYRNQVRAGYVILVAALISQTSFLVTHFVLKQYFTILVTSWLFFLAAGFYGMRPFIAMIRADDQHRFLKLMAAAGILVLVYSCYPVVPWIFQNNNRSSFLTPPLYFGLIFFLTELFYLLGRCPFGDAARRGMSFIGQQTLAIYLTHQAFAFLWGKVVIWPLALAVLAIGSGIVFGIITDRVYAILGRAIQRIFIRVRTPRVF